MTQHSGKECEQRGMREMIDNKVIIKEICLRIVGENELEINPKIMNRIAFFYEHVISACLEDMPGLVLACIDEICDFEKKWYGNNVLNLSLFEEYSIVNGVSLFLAISHQLAMDKFYGTEYQLMSVFLENLFNGFAEAVRENSDLDGVFIEEISDIRINLSYASGHSNIMSLALYNNMMKANNGGE